MFKELNIPNIFTMEASFCGADKGSIAGHHFSTEHLMLAGRRLLESLIVYSKIDVPQSIKQMKAVPKKAQKNSSSAIEREGNDGDQDIEVKKPCWMISAAELEKELLQNNQLIKLTTGHDDGESSGSDSQPSVDNLDAEEMAQLVPEAENKKPEK